MAQYEPILLHALDTMSMWNLNRIPVDLDITTQGGLHIIALHISYFIDDMDDLGNEGYNFWCIEVQSDQVEEALTATMIEMELQDLIEVFADIMKHADYLTVEPSTAERRCECHKNTHKIEGLCIRCFSQLAYDRSVGRTMIKSAKP